MEELTTFHYMRPVVVEARKPEEIPVKLTVG